MRANVNKFFMARLGTIPKKKNMKDTKVIRDILFALKQGENIGSSPEAFRNRLGSAMNKGRSTLS